MIAVERPNQRSRLNYNRPHPMLPVLGKPMVVRMMNQLHRQGIQQYTVIVGPDEGGVAAYLSQSWLPGVKIQFVLKPAGMSLGATLAGVVKDRHHPFLLADYTTFMPPNFIDRLRNVYRKHATGIVIGGAITSLSFDQKSYYGLLGERNSVKAVTRQQTDTARTLQLSDFAICGQSFRTFLVSHSHQVSHQKSLMDLFVSFLEAGGTVLSAEAAWSLCVEADADLMTINRHLLDENQDAHILSEVPVSVQIVPPVRIDPQVSVGQGAVIGPYVYLESGCSVGQDAQIQHSLVLAKGTVSAGEALSNMIVSSRYRIPV